MIINFNIPLSTAVTFLNERMLWELKFRKRAGFFEERTNLADLSYNELLPIVETALFDLVTFLPYDLLIQQNSLVEIFTNAIRSLAKIYGKEEFEKYSKKRCAKIIERIINLYSVTNSNKTYLNN